MIISGLQKLTLSDYPSKMSAIIFTQGCNFNCSYCHNSSLINKKNESLIPEDEVLEFLKKRKNILDGLVISGGEPTIQKDLEQFIIKVKALGYAVKLDTNGSNPLVIKKLIDKNLIDYIAMDVKNVFEDYDKVIKKKFDINKIKESIEIIKNSGISCEFRITIIKNYHNIKNITKICDYLGKNVKIYLQNFEDSQDVKDKTLESFDKKELIEIQKIINNKSSNVIVRGL